MVKLPRGEERLGPTSQLGMTAERARFGDVRWEDDLARGVEEGEHPVDVAAVPSVDELVHDRVVLGSTSPASISRKVHFPSARPQLETAGRRCPDGRRTRTDKTDPYGTHRPILKRQNPLRRAGSAKIGAPGFEPGTSPTRTVRATRLRHAPRAPVSRNCRGCRAGRRCPTGHHARVRRTRAGAAGRRSRSRSAGSRARRARAHGRAAARGSATRSAATPAACARTFEASASAG